MTARYTENLNKNAKEIRSGRIELDSMPRRLNVALTTACNISCRMCVVKNRNWEIPDERLSEIIGLFPYMESIIWQGGEVFLHKGFRDILETSRGTRNLRHEITTNGHLIDEDWMKLFEEISVDLNISIDAVEENVYNHIRKGSDFKNIIKVLDKINRHRKTGVRVLIFTLMRSNRAQIKGLPEFARKYGFDRVIIQPVKSNTDNNENIFAAGDVGLLEMIKRDLKAVRIKMGELGIELIDILPLKSDNGISSASSLRGPKDNKNAGLPACFAPWQQLFIEWGGYVYPHCLCIADGSNDMRIVGDVKNSSIRAIWNGEKMREFRSRMLSGRMAGLCNPACLEGSIARSMRDLNIGNESGKEHAIG